MPFSTGGPGQHQGGAELVETFLLFDWSAKASNKSRFFIVLGPGPTRAGKAASGCGAVCVKE